MTRTERVTKHKRRTKKGKWVDVDSFKRKAKPKKVKGIKKGKKVITETQYYHDDQGRLVPKRKTRVIS